MLSRTLASEGKPVPDHRSVAIHAQLARHRSARHDEAARDRSRPSSPPIPSSGAIGTARASATPAPSRSARCARPGTAACASRFTTMRPSCRPTCCDSSRSRCDGRRARASCSARTSGSTVEEALRAVTLDAAYGYFEEDRKGSLSPGKRADLVVLSARSAGGPDGRIDELAILETFARGRSVHASARARS